MEPITTTLPNGQSISFMVESVSAPARTGLCVLDLSGETTPPKREVFVVRAWRLTRRTIGRSLIRAGWFVWGINEAEYWGR